MQEPFAGAGHLYIAPPFVSWPLHDAERLVLPQNGEQAQPLHETLANVLLLCNQWRSLDEHTAIAIKEMPALQPHAQQIRQGLEHMVKQGLLVSAEQLAQNYANSATASTEHESIKTLYVRAFRCPQALERLLKSVQNGRSGASINTLVVIDDAREESDLEHSRNLLGSYRDKLSANLIHITRADRERMADTLATASGANADHLQWWLNGDPNDPEMSAGATFNTALLLSAGTTTALIDDDAQLTPIGDPEDTAAIKVASDENAKWTMYPSDESMESAWSPLDLDPLAAHSRWLGQSLSTLAEQTPQRESFWQSMTSADLHWLKTDAQVKVSVNGILGDPGTGSASWLYTLPTEQLAPWLESEESYRRLTSQRLMARQSEGQKVLPHHTLLSPLVGVDNRQLMPPTFPNGRGEDLLFADLVCCVYPESLFAQLPWMLKHEPEQKRQFDQEDLLTPRSVSACQVLAEYLHKLRSTIPSATTKTRLQWLGQSLQALAEAPNETLATDYQCHLTSNRADMSSEVMNNLRVLQPPPYLAADMQQLLANCRQGLASDQQNQQQVLNQVRDRAGHYSQALNSWCLAWEHCRQIGEANTLEMALKAPDANNRNQLLSFLRLRK